MSEEEEYDPEDTDCTRCNTTVAWPFDGFSSKPPEDPNDRICHACAYKELHELRKYKEDRPPRRVRVVQNPGTMALWSVELIGPGTDLFSVWLPKGDAEDLARMLRIELGILEDYVEERIKSGPPPYRMALLAEVEDAHVKMIEMVQGYKEQRSETARVERLREIQSWGKKETL